MTDPQVMAINLNGLSPVEMGATLGEHMFAPMLEKTCSEMTVPEEEGLHVFAGAIIGIVGAMTEMFGYAGAMAVFNEARTVIESVVDTTKPSSGVH